MSSHRFRVRFYRDEGGRCQACDYARAMDIRVVGLTGSISAERILHAVQCLRNMKNAGQIKEDCAAVYELEHQGDILMRSAIGKLFKEETNMVKLIQWKEIYERLEKATDRCEAVASIIQGIVIEAS